MSLLDLLERPVYRTRRDFSGSLDFIDRLPSRRPFVVKGSDLQRARDLVWITNALANRPGRAVISPTSVARGQNRSKLSSFTPVCGVQDRRLWHPEGDRAPLSISESGASRIVVETDKDRFERIHRQVLKKPMESWFATATPLADRENLKVRHPNKVWICLKRKQRREMMHVLGVAGSLVGLPHLTDLSKVRC